MMKVTHKFHVQGICPVDNSADHYEVEVILFTDDPNYKTPLAIETMLAVCQDLLSEPCFQELFTHQLAALLQAKVTTWCRHSTGVATTCVCE